jgi:DNA polymerase III subunit alpha
VFGGPAVTRLGGASVSLAAVEKQESPGTEKSDSGRMPGFVHLHCHSAFSLLEGALPMERLLKLADQDRQPALAVTDRCNLFGALEFSEKAAGRGIQPIMGASLPVDFLDGADRKPKFGLGTPGSVVVLAKDEEGFGNLIRLLTKAHLGDEERAGEYSGPHVNIDELRALQNGLIVLSGGPEGPIDSLWTQGRGDAAGDRILRLREIFGDRLYIELQRHGDASAWRERETFLIDQAYGAMVPLVATNEPFFAAREDFEAHDALICIAQGTVINVDDRRRLTPDHYFKSRAEMAALFGDLPEALENTVEIARRCAFRAKTRSPILPRYSKDGSDFGTDNKAESEELCRQARAGLEQRLAEFEPAPGYSRGDYESRLETELSIIEEMGFPGYFLIVADFIQWAKGKGIPVGPGRGSGAGSLVAWALTITDIDPMRFSLLFERFLNPQRVSMPDFDIDFCQDRRDEVIRYVQARYGKDRVAQIITFGTLQARAVLRDVGRVLQMPYGQVDRLAKLVPSNPANPVTLKQAIADEPRLREAAAEEEIVARLFDIAMRLEGLYRHASTHAAGIVIGDRKLEELVPLYRDPRSEMPVTQYSMKWVEAAGLVKFDFLGLKTLTVLQRALEFIRGGGGEVDLGAIPLDDAKTYELLARGDTVGIFQLESTGMRKALIGMRPDRFEDIIALVALYRPGPMDNIPLYNARKNGTEKSEYIHEKIEPVLKETHGVIIYQEQVMQIAQILSGYSLGEADLLRRAMGKKIREEMDSQRARFVDGAVERGLTKFKADEIFDLLAKFADYGFNKSHAAAYALVSYQTAYVKAGFPVEFLAASLDLDINNTDKLAVFHQEARHLGIEVVPPSVQTSSAGFTVGDGKIYYALAAVKGVGESAVSQIVAERQANGPFASLTDFFSRLDTTHINKRALENLIYAGAFDCFGQGRERLLAGLDRLIGHASRTALDRDSGQNDMFAASGTSQEIQLPPAQAWSVHEKLHLEFQAIGFYLSAHPLDEYRSVMDRERVQLYVEFEKSVRAGVSAGRLAGTVTARQDRKTRMGKRMAILQLSDPSGQYEAVVFEEGLAQYDELFEVGKALILLVGADLRPEGVNIRIQSAHSLEDQANRASQNMRIFLRDEMPAGHILPVMAGLGRGEGSVSLILIREAGEVEIELKEHYRLNRQIAGAIKAVPGVLDVELV